MWHRVSKQLLYGVFYLAILAMIGFFIYAFYFKPAPSCFDHIQNQGESGVDCGGPCAIACLPSNLEPLAQNGGVSILPIDAKHVGILASVANPNQTEAAKSFDYTLTLYGVGTTTIATIPGNSYVYAGEVKYLVLPNVSVSAIPFRVDLALDTPTWVPAAQFQKPNLATPNYATTISSLGNLEVDGTIVNHDVLSFASIELVAIFYGSLGTPVGVSETQISNLGLNESRTFTILHPPLLGADLTATKVFPYTKQ